MIGDVNGGGEEGIFDIVYNGGIVIVMDIILIDDLL